MEESISRIIQVTYKKVIILLYSDFPILPHANMFSYISVATVETADWISSQGVGNVIGFNLDGSVNVQEITVSMTPAFQSSD